MAVPVSEPARLVRGARTFGWQEPVVVLLVALFLLVPFWHGFKTLGGPMDEGALLLYPELILKGDLPYRDFETFYGPGNLYTLAGVYAVFGDNIVVERSVGLAYRFLVLLAVFLLARRWGVAIAAGCMAVTGFLLVSTGITAQTWLGGLACALWSLWLISKTDSGPRAAAGGLLAGCALLFRQDLALAIIPSALPLFLAMPRPVKWKYVAGAIMGILPMAVLLIAVGWEQMFNNLVLFPIFRCNTARRMPLFSADQDLLFLFALQVLASFVNIAVGLIALRADRRNQDARLLLGLALLAVGMTHQVVQRIDLNHILSAGAISFGLLSLSLLILVSLRFPIAPSRWSAPAAVGAVMVMINFASPDLIIGFSRDFKRSLGLLPWPVVFLEHADRSFPFAGGAKVKGAGKMLEKIDRLSLPGERLFVGPADLRRTNYNDTFFYHLLPRLHPATYFLEMNPRSANRVASRLTADVASADWLILNPDWDLWNEPNQSSEFASDAPNAVVRDRFQLVGMDGGYLLYRKKPTL